MPIETEEIALTLPKQVVSALRAFAAQAFTTPDEVATQALSRWLGMPKEDLFWPDYLSGSTT